LLASAVAAGADILLVNVATNRCLFLEIVGVKAFQVE
jgi:hypothetical protein